MAAYDFRISEVEARQGRRGLGSGRVIFIAFLIALVLVVSLVTLGAVVLYNAMDLGATFGVGDRPVNLLFIGTDRSYDEHGRPLGGATRADTLILISLDPRSGEVNFISLPRDTRVRVPGHGTGKINVAHAIGGVELTIRTIEDFLGIPIDGYVETDFRGFVAMVDALGGVTIDVEKDMHYEDRAGNFRIDLKKGLQHLDGQKALEYVRFRHDALGDIGRVARQQKLLTALFSQALTLENARKYRDILGIISEAVDTDLVPQRFIAVGLFLWRNRGEGFNAQTLPGHFSPVYWVPDEEGIRRLVEGIWGS